MEVGHGANNPTLWSQGKKRKKKNTTGKMKVYTILHSTMPSRMCITNWQKWVVSFTLRPPVLLIRNSRYPLDETLARPTVVLGVAYGEDKNQNAILYILFQLSHLCSLFKRVEDELHAHVSSPECKVISQFNESQSLPPPPRLHSPA
jgi:hypothetical protein